MDGKFKEQMQELLGDRFPEFEAAYENKPRHKALRVNTLKISVDDFVLLANSLEQSGAVKYNLKSNPLCDRSFYTEVKPSTDPLYHAGLYYMQEPSASAAVAAFSPYIGRRVLDLCAAPGGKSTQAAAYMKDGGTLFCNEIEYVRARALVENLDRLGVSNAVVTVGDAKMYRRAGYDGYFDTLIVDAPCSGGGMTRYEDVPYSKEIVAGCASRQRDILDDAAELVCVGGYMLYSTCTFSREENEDNVRYITEKGFTPVDVPLRAGEERGIDLPQARRVYPHSFDGEGHFYCVLRKTSGEKRDIVVEKVKPTSVRIKDLALDCYSVCGAEILSRVELKRGGLNAIRVGAEVFERGEKRDGKKTGGKLDREISHAFTHAITKEQASMISVELSYDDATRYIRGEQLEVDAPRGIVVVTTHGYAIGKARASGDGAGGVALKNLYPKTLRV